MAVFCKQNHDRFENIRIVDAQRTHMTVSRFDCLGSVLKIGRDTRLRLLEGRRMV